MWASLRRWLRGKPPRRRSAPFMGAQLGRLSASLPGSSASINSDLDGALVIMRARARSLCANHEYGRRFLSMVATNVVGAYGPTLQVRAYNLPPPNNPKATATLDKPANAAVEGHWKRWGKKCDITGMMTLPQLLRVAMKSVARDGEVLIRKVRRRDLPYGLALQMLEIDRLDEGMNGTLANGNIVRQGVEIDPYQRRVAYYVRKSHPGDPYAQSPKVDAERVLADEIFHLFVPERAEQVRGYTWMHAVLHRSQMLQGYEEAALTAARVGAAKMGVFRSDGSGDTNELDDIADRQTDGSLHMSAEPGEFLDLTGRPGVTLESWSPEYPRGEFGAFVQQCLRGIAAGLDVDYATLANDLSSVNYSSIRAGTIETREMWILLQEWLIDAFLVPVYREWLSTALPMGAITFDSGSRLPAERLEKFADAGSFVGRRWPWVDPLKDAQASKELIAAGLASRTEIAASQGRDFADIVDELAAEKELMEEAGIIEEPPEPAAPPATDPAAEDDAEEEKALRRRHISALEQAALRQPTINIAPPAVNVTIDGAKVNVEPADVRFEPTINVAPAEVNLEATMPVPSVEVRAEAPVVNVAAPEVTVNVEPEVKVELPPRRTDTSVTRDRDGNIVTATQIERSI